jgi:DNA repair exonuclease SbcCD nuclease subunit
VIHGGDVLYRSKVPPGLVAEAFEPLKEIASSGIPVYIVPGNHERSEIPYGLLASHPNIFIFNRPRSFGLNFGSRLLLLCGFPFFRGDIRSNFNPVLGQTNWTQFKDACRILCVHQCFEGSTVGPSEFVFRNRPDTIRVSDIPDGFTAVVNGHIHRAQILIRDHFTGKRIPPVIHPGSTERTSFAEKDEEKGFIILELDLNKTRSMIHEIHFESLPTRKMVRIDLEPIEIKKGELRRCVQNILQDQQKDSIVQIRIRQRLPSKILGEISNPKLRDMVPETMNVSVSLNFRAESNHTGLFHLAPKSAIIRNSGNK